MFAMNMVSRSPQVFQAFFCEEFEEIGKSFLRADQSIECYTRMHDAFRTYAAVMIFLCEFTWCQPDRATTCHRSVFSFSPRPNAPFTF